MTQKLWQKKQKLNYRKEVIDIVQYGSSVIENKKPNDIDIAVIYSKLNLKEQLEEGQRIKKQINKESDLPVHVNNFDLEKLFSSGNFAKEDILFYGKSLVHGNEFSRRFNLIPKLRIKYTLSHLEKKEKVKFNYLLNGKKNNYGLIRKYGGKILSPGIIEIPPEYEERFMEKMKKITKELSIKRIFEQLR